jgi:hypothetical protein
MILFVDDNAGILFIKRWVDKLWGYIGTFTTVVGNLTTKSIKVLIAGSVATYTITLADIIGHGYLSGVINTMTGVYGTFAKWLTEIFDKISEVTKLFKRDSNIDGD